jgi:hypothetical protein
MCPVIEASISGEVVDLDPSDGSRGLVGVGLELIVQCQSIVEFSQFRRDDASRRPTFLTGLLGLGAKNLGGSGDKTMAVHARVRVGHPRMGASFRAGVAIKASNLQLPGVLLMGERDGLIGSVPLLVAR